MIHSLCSLSENQLHDFRNMFKAERILKPLSRLENFWTFELKEQTKQGMPGTRLDQLVCGCTP